MVSALYPFSGGQLVFNCWTVFLSWNKGVIQILKEVNYKERLLLLPPESEGEKRVTVTRVTHPRD